MRDGRMIIENRTVQECKEQKLNIVVE